MWTSERFDPGANMRFPSHQKALSIFRLFRVAWVESGRVPGMLKLGSRIIRSMLDQAVAV